MKPLRVGEIGWEVGVDREEDPGPSAGATAEPQSSSCASLPPFLCISSKSPDLRALPGHPV